MRATAVVMARAPRPGGCNRRLEPSLGAERCATLQAVLVRRAAAWACEVAPEAAVVAFEPPDAGAQMAGLAGDAELWPQADVAAAASTAFERFGGPVLLAATDMPRLRAEHAAAALMDLREGADVAVGPAHDGGWYLMALAAPRPELLAEKPVAAVLQAAARLRLEVGLLRMERKLSTPEDAAAVAADPLMPAEIRAAVRPAPA